MVVAQAPYCLSQSTSSWSSRRVGSSRKQVQAEFLAVNFFAPRNVRTARCQVNAVRLAVSSRVVRVLRVWYTYGTASKAFCSHVGILPVLHCELSGVLHWHAQVLHVVTSRSYSLRTRSQDSSSGSALGCGWRGGCDEPFSGNSYSSAPPGRSLPVFGGLPMKWLAKVLAVLLGQWTTRQADAAAVVVTNSLVCHISVLGTRRGRQ